MVLPPAYIEKDIVSNNRFSKVYSVFISETKTSEKIAERPVPIKSHIFHFFLTKMR